VPALTGVPASVRVALETAVPSLSILRLARQSPAAITGNADSDDRRLAGRSPRGRAQDRTGRGSERPALGAERLIRVLLVSHMRLYREGLARLLAGEPRLYVAATASESSQALALARRMPVDAALVDLVARDRIPLVRALAAMDGGPVVVGLGVRETEEDVVAAAEAGVDAFVGMEATVAELVQSIDGATRGELVCSPRVSGILRRRVAAMASGPASNPDVRLTAREADIMELIAAGFTNRDVADRLCIQLSTVKNHLHHVFEKLHARDRREAVQTFRALTAGRRF
jgi:two-component system, NarL family, nitrate/nitrite response regulator NarL